MTLWLPFDECNGAIAKNLAGPRSGTLKDAAFWTDAGKVGCAVCFDGGYVDVPSHAAVQPEFGDFTIDAWIKPHYLPISGGIRQIIVDKMAFSSTFVPHGYSFYLLDTTLCCTVSDGVGPGSNFTGPALPVSSLDTWVHVAVAVTHNSSTTAPDFYLNGVKTAPFIGSLDEGGSLSSPAPFRVGAASTSFTTNLDGFSGCIDEVEFFKRHLSEDEIKSIYRADSIGKCKQFCQAPADAVFCKDAASITVTVPICNGTNIDRYYTLSFPTVTGCGNIASPSGISSNNPLVFVPPFSCTDVTLTIPRPPFTQAGDKSCYSVCATSMKTCRKSRGHGDSHSSIRASAACSRRSPCGMCSRRRSRLP